MNAELSEFPKVVIQINEINEGHYFGDLTGCSKKQYSQLEMYSNHLFRSLKQHAMIGEEGENCVSNTKGAIMGLTLSGISIHLST